jgi:putative heme-binding domain-containing protein
MRALPPPRLMLCLYVLAALAGLSARADDPPSAVGSVMRLLQSGRVPPQRLGPILELVCSKGNEQDLAFVYGQVLSPDVYTSELRLQVLRQLADAARTRKVAPAGDLTGITDLIAADDPALQRAAVTLAGLWKVAGAAAALRAIAARVETDPALRAAALDALVALGAEAARPTIDALAAQGQPFALRALAAGALVRFDVEVAARVAADILNSAGERDDPASLIDAFLGRKGASDMLAAAIETHPPSGDIAKLALRHMYSVGRSDAALSNALGKLAGITTDPQPPSKEEVAALNAEVAEKGDPARGEDVFRRADLSCVKCHAVSQAGGQIGPDLSALGSSSPVDYIVNSIFDPDAQIKEAFHTKVVLTSDGEVVHGLIADRTADRLVLKDANGQLKSIPLADIDDEVEGKSLMPKGLVKFMTHAELVDLVKFLSMLGKPGDYAVRSTPRMQRWRVLRNVPADLRADVPNRLNFEDRVLNASDWAPAYARVNGTLPLEEVVKLAGSEVLYVQGEVDVTEAGPVGIRVDAPPGTHAWVDAESFETRGEFTTELSAGRHRITLRVPVTSESARDVKLELSRLPGSRTEFVTVDGA